MREIKMVRVPGCVFLALFSIGAVFIIVRQIPSQTMLAWGIDKIAHFSVSWLLAVIFLWVSKTPYQIGGQKAKIAVFFWVLMLGILWEVAEFSGLKATNIFTFPGVRNGWLNYGVDTGLDLMFDACGALWYLYAPEMFLFSSDSDPVP